MTLLPRSTHASLSPLFMCFLPYSFANVCATRRGKISVASQWTCNIEHSVAVLCIMYYVLYYELCVMYCLLCIMYVHFVYYVIHYAKYDVNCEKTLIANSILTLHHNAQ